LWHIELLALNGLGLVVKVIRGLIPQELAVILMQIVPLGRVARTTPRYVKVGELLLTDFNARLALALDSLLRWERDLLT
jgi:hypothetical protein